MAISTIMILVSCTYISEQRVAAKNGKSGTASQYNTDSYINNTDKSEAASQNDNDSCIKSTSDNASLIGSTVKMGFYEKNPLEWTVLGYDANGMLLLCNDCIECLPFNFEDADVSWQDCTLREWLNDEFYNTAFSSSEKENIILAKINNSPCDEFLKFGLETENSSSSVDRVFLLSVNEAKQYLTSSKMRKAFATEHAKSAGVHEWGKTFAVHWWLRNNGYCKNTAAYVNHGGTVEIYGTPVNTNEYGVRPAIYIECE